MMDLEQTFQEAAAKSKTLTKQPSNEILLKLYGLYKQGSQGDVSGNKPGMFDMVGQAKYAAWEKLKGKSKLDAMQEYIDLVNSLFE